MGWGGRRRRKGVTRAPSCFLSDQWWLGARASLPSLISNHFRKSRRWNARPRFGHVRSKHHTEVRQISTDRQITPHAHLAVYFLPRKMFFTSQTQFDIQKKIKSNVLMENCMLGITFLHVNLTSSIAQQLTLPRQFPTTERY